MSLLDSFKKVNLPGSAQSVSISSYGLTFNKSAVETLGLPAYVELFLDEEGKRLALVASQSSENIPFCINKSNKINARINNKEFARKLYALMGWDLSNDTFRCYGVWHQEEKVLIFNLSECEKIVANKEEESDQ